MGVNVGLQPSRVVVAFLKDENYNGSLLTNPFHFQNLDITRIALKMNGKNVPYSSGLELDFANNAYHEGYRSLFQNIQEMPLDISYKDYKNGFTTFAFSLAPDFCNLAEHVSIFKDGQLDLDIEFKHALDKSITTIFYLEYDSLLEVTKQRNIVFDYQV
jgi:hypothetical protein